ncbi:unnamed protein product [Trichobilharzia szidati]|nr:unnamed protein product [Trichobilharzia szidati]
MRIRHNKTQLNNLPKRTISQDGINYYCWIVTTEAKPHRDKKSRKSQDNLSRCLKANASEYLGINCFCVWLYLDTRWGPKPTNCRLDRCGLLLLLDITY